MKLLLFLAFALVLVIESGGKPNPSEKSNYSEGMVPNERADITDRQGM